MQLPITNYQFSIRSKFHSSSIFNRESSKPKNKWQVINGKWKMERGYSLLEMLVVVSIFAILGILITRSVIMTLGGAKKSENLVAVRDNLNYSIGVMERQLRNANSITDCSNLDPGLINGTVTSIVDYNDQDGNPAWFSCNNVGTGLDGYIASGSSQLSSDEVNITTCTFTCTPNSDTPSSITIDLAATDASGSGTENSIVTASTQIFLRNY
jgi:prepilin-type N-terminal cleavage/methylation domain-containing protein